MIGEKLMTEFQYIAAGYIVDKNLPDITIEDLTKLTHLNIAFGHVTDDAVRTDHLQNLNLLPEMKRNFPHIKLILSVGGWSAGGFSEAASTEAGRAKMAESSVQAVIEHGFDGIDLDWEYPSYGEAGIASSPEDKTNFTLILQAIREALDVQGGRDGRHYSLTIAVGADQYYVDGTEMDKVQHYLDFVQLMTYDMRGGFQVLTGHHTNLFTPTGDLFRISTEASAKLFMNAGVPREKIVIGVAFYSRMWQQVPNRNNGLHQMAGTTGTYGPSYDELTPDYINSNNFQRYWDDEAKAPYLFNGHTFISYDDEESIRYKCDYIKQQGFAGIMFWEYGCDRTKKLLNTLHSNLEMDTSSYKGSDTAVDV